MKTINTEQLSEILGKHKSWLADEDGGERANLRGASSIWGCHGNKLQIKSIACDTYDVSYMADKMQIGCQFHGIEEWWAFSDGEISRMGIKALAWWKIWKPILKTIIEASPAVPGKQD